MEDRSAGLRRGSGLIAALWVIALLSLLISAFAFDMHLEARIISYCRKRLKAEYLARGGVEYARALLTRSTAVTDNRDTDPLADKPWYEDAVRIKQGLAVHVTVPLGEGEIALDIMPEPARRNVNGLKDEDWERILAVGGVPEESWGILIDSYNDWRDADDQPGVDGAETDDYYARLEPPYQARGRNGAAATLDTVDELLLIRGFSREILYGGVPPGAEEGTPALRGIADLLTATPNQGVNINAASRDVLKTLPGIDDAMADAIIAKREGLTAGGQISKDSYFKSSADLFSRVPELNGLDAEERSYLTELLKNMGSQAFRIVASGKVHGVTRQIACVVQFNAGQMQVLRWTEQEG
jgi:hypothetical protein